MSHLKLLHSFDFVKQSFVEAYVVVYVVRMFAEGT